MAQEKYLLTYWPIPFRGSFISYILAYHDIPFREENSFEEIQRQRMLPSSEQDIPFIGPPVLKNLETDFTISQMPAIVLYLTHELNFNLSTQEHVIQLKTIMDCNDILTEICRYNGSYMWERETWLDFRHKRLPKWFALFEESISRGFIGQKEVSVSDLCVYALFGNIMRCLPELKNDVQKFAPKVDKLCQKIIAKPSLSEYVDWQEANYAKLYCGGQIEQSIREMLAMDQLQ